MTTDAITGIAAGTYRYGTHAIFHTASSSSWA
jgi:hypothetical protein